MIENNGLMVGDRPKTAQIAPPNSEVGLARRTTRPRYVGHFQSRPGHGSAGSSGRLAGDSKGLGGAQTVLRETWV